MFRGLPTLCRSSWIVWNERAGSRHREDGRLVAICGAPAPHQLVEGARTLMTMTSRVGSISASESEKNVRTAGQKNLVIVGATGMVGGYALRYALEHPAVGLVTTIGRRKVDISHPKLNEVIHQDFANCSALAQALTDQQAAIFCLGA